MDRTKKTKEIVVSSEISPIADAVMYYTKKVNGCPVSASAKRMREQYPESRESIDTLFGPLEKLERELDEISKGIDEERLSFFFETLGELPAQSRRTYHANLATAIMMPSPFAPNVATNLAEHCDKIRQYSEEEIIFFARMTFSLPNEGWLQKECKDLATFYDYLFEYPASDAERFRILSIVRNFHKYVDELKEILAPVVTAIAESRPSYQFLLDRFAEVYRGKPLESVFDAREDMHICSSDATVFAVFPLLFAVDEYRTVCYRMAADDPLCNRIEIGVLYDASKRFSKREIHVRDIASCVKVIGDPVRMGILSLLKDGEVYVQDLTEKLNLSFTTVSHHMTKLMMAGLVTSERRGIYVYYKANTEFIHWLMERVSELLLKQE